MTSRPWVFVGLAVLSGVCVLKSGLSTPIRMSLIVAPDNARLLRQRQRRVSLHQPRSASADEACGDRLALRVRQGRHRRCSGTPCPDHLPVWRNTSHYSLLQLLCVLELLEFNNSPVLLIQMIDLAFP